MINPALGSQGAIVFLILLSFIAIEALLYAKVLHRPLKIREVLGSLFVAIPGRFIRLISVPLFQVLLERVSPWQAFSIEMSRPWQWVLLFFLFEFCYYWMHRSSHYFRWMWANHRVHHTSNQLTLSSALRLGWTGLISGTPLFFAPLIFLGFPARAVITVFAINLLYQFWLHTELVPKLGFIEKILNTPANHCVHHAINPQYVDKNFGGVIVLYDRIFGTYQSREETCVFGVVPAETSLNPIRLALSEWGAMAKDFFNTYLGVKTRKRNEKTNSTVRRLRGRS